MNIYMNRRYNKKQTHGAALIAAIIILTIIAFTGATVARLTTHTQTDSSFYRDSSTSLINAEAALDSAAATLTTSINNNTYLSTDPASIVAPANPATWWINDAGWASFTASKQGTIAAPTVQGTPNFRIEYIGPSYNPEDSDKRQAQTHFYRVTAAANGQIGTTANDTDSEAIIQAHISQRH